jgi:hypothetical protein
MVNIPSKPRSDAIRAMANNLDLTEPYRMLNPVRKEFTYIPNARININRSRIDYFLTSKNLTEFVSAANIVPVLLSSSFDHKKVTLTIGKVKKVINFDKINETLLRKREVELSVKAKIIECYLIHADPDATPRYLITGLLVDIGRIDRLIRDQIKHEHGEPDLNVIIRNEINMDRIDQAEAIFETLPELDFFLNLPLSCEPDFFFESLVSNVRLTTLSLQAYINKEKNNMIREKKTELDALKSDYDLNLRRISDLEQQIQDYNEMQLRCELENYKVFDRLNMEKITPHFLNLAKKSNEIPDLSRIKNNDGQEFTSEPERGDFITEFYKSLYKKPTLEPVLEQDCITTFLVTLLGKYQCKTLS